MLLANEQKRGSASGESRTVGRWPHSTGGELRISLGGMTNDVGVSVSSFHSTHGLPVRSLPASAERLRSAYAGLSDAS